MTGQEDRAETGGQSQAFKDRLEQSNFNIFSCKSCSYSVKHFDCLRIVSWNVKSWTLNNSYLRECIVRSVNPDIIFISESRLKPNETISLIGYEWNGHNRQNQMKTAKSGTRGVGLLVKSELKSNWRFEELDKTVDGIYVTCLVNKRNNTKIMLVPCYLPPENSKWETTATPFLTI